MKKVVLSMNLIFLMLFAVSNVFAQSPVGTWKTIDDETGKVNSQIQIYKSGNTLRGKIVKIYPAPGEERNPKCTKCTGADKNKPILGLVIMKNIKKDGNEWGNGTIFDPKKGKSYNCKIWCDGNDKLNVRGYLGWFYRTQTWKRVK